MSADFPWSSAPLPQQRAIAGYLDRETARVDALVAVRRSGCSPCWPKSAGRSSVAPSPAVSTQASRSVTLVSHGSARFRRIGSTERARWLFGSATNVLIRAKKNSWTVSHLNWRNSSFGDGCQYVRGRDDGGIQDLSLGVIWLLTHYGPGWARWSVSRETALLVQPTTSMSPGPF